MCCRTTRPSRCFGFAAESHPTPRAVRCLTLSTSDAIPWHIAYAGTSSTPRCRVPAEAGQPISTVHLAAEAALAAGEDRSLGRPQRLAVQIGHRLLADDHRGLAFVPDLGEPVTDRACCCRPPNATRWSMPHSATARQRFHWCNRSPSPPSNRRACSWSNAPPAAAPPFPCRLSSPTRRRSAPTMVNCASGSPPRRQNCTTTSTNSCGRACLRGHGSTRHCCADSGMVR
jgi:hypothetical protein